MQWCQTFYNYKIENLFSYGKKWHILGACLAECYEAGVQNLYNFYIGALYDMSMLKMCCSIIPIINISFQRMAEKWQT
jgi:hypothetical protein